MLELWKKAYFEQWEAALPHGEASIGQWNIIEAKPSPPQLMFRKGEICLSMSEHTISSSESWLLRLLALGFLWFLRASPRIYWRILMAFHSQIIVLPEMPCSTDPCCIIVTYFVTSNFHSTASHGWWIALGSSAMVEIHSPSRIRGQDTLIFCDQIDLMQHDVGVLRLIIPHGLPRVVFEGNWWWNMLIQWDLLRGFNNKIWDSNGTYF